VVSPAFSTEELAASSNVAIRSECDYENLDEKPALPVHPPPDESDLESIL
jgi:hypothetical protein